MTISLSDTARSQSIASIRRYFAEELELDVGVLAARIHPALAVVPVYNGNLRTPGCCFRA